MKETITNLLLANKIDIINIKYLYMAQYVPEAYKSILSIYELRSLACYRKFKNDSILKKFPTFLSILKMLNYEVKVLNKFNLVVTLTGYEKKLLNFLSPHLKTEVSPLGVDCNYFSKDAEKEDTDLIFIGYFLHPPNIDAMIYFCSKIFPLIKKELPDTTLTIIGYKPPPEIVALGKNRSVTVTGYIDDIRPYITDSKVYIVPVRLGAGMRGKILEAWAMAKPVVSTSIGCQGFDAVDGENISIANKPEVFAQKTITLLKDKELRLKLGKNGRKLAETKHDWKIIAQNLEEIYKNVI